MLKSSARCWETNAVSSILRLLLNQGSSKLREMQGASTARLYVLRDTDDADVRCGDCLQECTCTRACIYCLYLFIYIYMCVIYFFNIIYNCMILYGIQNHLWIHVVHIPDSVYLSIDQLYAKADFSSNNGHAAATTHVSAFAHTYERSNSI